MRGACRDPYCWGLTRKLRAALSPAAVVTATLTVPTLAVLGTLHLISESLQEMYSLHVLLPDFTVAAPCVAPHHLPMTLTRARRLPAAGLTLLRMGAGAMTVNEPALGEIRSHR